MEEQLEGLVEPTKIACAASLKPMTDTTDAFPMLGVIVKPIGLRCNLNCAYCFYTEEERRVHTEPMSLEILERIVRDALECAEECCTFYWHGGEPTLAGLSFYRKAMEFQAKYHRPNQIVENLTQTNGTLLTEEWARFYHEHDFGVGVSIDGTAWSHNLHRTNLGGHGTWRQVPRGIKLPQEADASFGVIGVLTRQTSSSEELLKKVRSLREIGIHSMAFNYCREVDPNTGELSAQSITADEYAQAVETLFDYWSSQNDAALDIREVDGHIAPLIGQLSYSTRTSGRCDQFITIDRDGNVAPCDCFGGGRQYLRFGSLLDSSLHEILNGHAANDFRSSVARALYPECTDCEWFHACRGGCVYERFFYRHVLHRPEEFCAMRKRIFRYILERLEETLARVGT